MHYQLAGASTELSWQISCYIVDRAAEKIFNIFSLAMDFASLAGETTQNYIVRPKNNKKIKKRNQNINKTQTTKKTNSKGQDTDIWVLYLFGSGVLYA